MWEDREQDTRWKQVYFSKGNRLAFEESEEGSFYQYRDKTEATNK
jgi:hypothetical protein